jgi:hypothetical protein
VTSYQSLFNQPHLNDNLPPCLASITRLLSLYLQLQSIAIQFIMAILSFYKVEILVNGVALEEYDDDDPERRHIPPIPTLVKYVEATSGAEFSIRYVLLPECKVDEDLGTEDLAWKTFLEGTKSQTSVTKCLKLSQHGRQWERKGVEVGRDKEWYFKKYKFADLVTGKLESIIVIFLAKDTFSGDVDAHVAPEEMRAIYSSLGLIRMEVWRYKEDRWESSGKTPKLAQVPDYGTVPEKALKGKALSLSTTFVTKSMLWTG